MSDYDTFRRHVVYRALIGSRAYGLDRPDSDWDWRGIFVPPASMHWALNKAPDQIDAPTGDEMYFEIEKFLNLALQANPNILEILYSPTVGENSIPELVENKHRFLSKRAFATYNGYAKQQFHKLEQDQRRGEVRWKHAMHLIRLLLSGITIFEEGRVLVNVAGYRDQLLSIRNGEWTWDQLNAEQTKLHVRFEEVFKKSSIPVEPDRAWANQFLLQVRRGAVEP